MRTLFLALWTVLLACAPEVAPPVVAPPAAAPSAGAPTSPPLGVDLVAAFTESCAYEVLAPFEGVDGPGTAPECVAQDFDQNCAPDQLGCWTAYEGCRTGCDTGCTGCAAACTRGCEDCKTACAGRADGGACVRACATSRLLCRDTCMAMRTGCREAACPEAMTRCEADGAARRDRECTECAAFAACVNAHTTDPGVCDRQFARMGAWCLGACQPDP